MTALTRKENVRYIAFTSCGYLTALTRKESVRYIAFTFVAT